MAADGAVSAPHRLNQASVCSSVCNLCKSTRRESSLLRSLDHSVLSGLWSDPHTDSTARIPAETAVLHRHVHEQSLTNKPNTAITAVYRAKYGEFSCG